MSEREKDREADRDNTVCEKERERERERGGGRERERETKTHRETKRAEIEICLNVNNARQADEQWLHGVVISMQDKFRPPADMAISQRFIRPLMYPPRTSSLEASTNLNVSAFAIR